MAIISTACSPWIWYHVWSPVHWYLGHQQLPSDALPRPRCWTRIVTRSVLCLSLHRTHWKQDMRLDSRSARTVKDISYWSHWIRLCAGWRNNLRCSLGDNDESCHFGVCGLLHIRIHPIFLDVCRYNDVHLHVGDLPL